MAEQPADGRQGGEQPERRRAAGGVSLAEEGSDELPALLAIAVGIAVIVVILGGTTFDWRAGGEPSSGDAAVGETEEATTGTTEAEPPEDEAGEAEAEGIAEADLQGLAGQFPELGISAAGGIITLNGEVADEVQRSEVVAAAGAVPGVTEVDDQLTIAASEGAAVDVAASQASIVLSGTVPDQAIADEILTRAQAIYAEEQIDNQIAIDDRAGPPVMITVSGSMTDEVLYNQVLTGFDGIIGIEPIDAAGLELQESNELESSLNALEAIQFSSGSALILSESEPILDQAAEFLLANPDVAIEIGGHTDSVGEPGGNQTLSQARADAVRAALQQREVANEMVSRGFGETRLKHDPDDTPEKQQENRRIEFRIL